MSYTILDAKSEDYRLALEESEARLREARLQIADLLAALKMLLATLEINRISEPSEAQLEIRRLALAAGKTPNKYVLDVARAAIAKAEGQGQE